MSVRAENQRESKIMIAVTGELRVIIAWLFCGVISLWWLERWMGATLFILFNCIYIWREWGAVPVTATDFGVKKSISFHAQGMYKYYLSSTTQYISLFQLLIVAKTEAK